MADNVRRRRAADAAVRRQRHSSNGGHRLEVWISVNGLSQSQTQNINDDDDNDADDLGSLPLVEVMLCYVMLWNELVLGAVMSQSNCKDT